MKKKLILLCVLCLLIAGLAVNAYADDGPAMSITPSTSNAKVNDVITFTVAFNNSQDGQFRGGNVEIDFDPDIFEYVDGSLAKCAGVPTSENFIVDDFSNDEGYFSVTISATAGYNSGNVFTFQLKAKAIGTDKSAWFSTAFGELNFMSTDVYDSAAKSYGKVTITAAPCAANEHTYVEDASASTNSTCSVAGKKVEKCSKCGDTKETTRPLANHTFSDVSATPGTDCQHKGTVAHKHCSTCNKDFATTAANNAPQSAALASTALNNGTYGNHSISATKTPEVAATCKATGTKEYYACTVSGCGKKFAEQAGTTDITNNLTLPIDATNHASLEHHDADPATCDAAGTVEYYHCNDCNKDFSDEAGTAALTSVVDPQKSHSKATGKGQAYKAATASEDGTLEVFYCDNCHEWYKGDATNSGAYTKLTADEKAKAVADDFSDFIIAKGTSSTGTGSNKPGTSTGDKKAPKTGDETNIALWVVLFVLCATVVTVVATKKLRKN